MISSEASDYNTDARQSPLTRGRGREKPINNSITTLGEGPNAEATKN